MKELNQNLKQKKLLENGEICLAEASKLINDVNTAFGYYEIVQ